MLFCLERQEHTYELPCLKICIHQQNATNALIVKIEVIYYFANQMNAKNILSVVRSSILQFIWLIYSYTRHLCIFMFMVDANFYAHELVRIQFSTSSLYLYHYISIKSCKVKYIYINVWRALPLLNNIHKFRSILWNHNLLMANQRLLC